ncbi:MAG: response regulator [Candidatus Omnitrophica bacterium]|nr:response regulator [Candidatus Omnitrophota bacterium]
MGRKNILLIDDNPTELNILKSLFEHEGYETVCVETCSEGVKYIKSSKVDIAVIDTLVPDINGFETCRMILESSGVTPPKIVMITSSIDATDAVKARRMGADDYVVKTQDFLILVEAVKKLL